jgi:hypothetical protein
VAGDDRSLIQDRNFRDEYRKRTKILRLSVLQPVRFPKKRKIEGFQSIRLKGKVIPVFN